MQNFYTNENFADFETSFADFESLTSKIKKTPSALIVLHPCRNALTCALFEC